MPEYKEQSLAGKQWTRGCRVVIDNPRNAVPTVSIFEEKVFLSEEGTDIIIPSGSFVNDFNPEGVFDLHDPATNKKIDGETFSGKELYQMIYSYYMNLAKARDEKQKM